MRPSGPSNPPSSQPAQSPKGPVTATPQVSTDATSPAAAVATNPPTDRSTQSVGTSNGPPAKGSSPSRATRAAKDPPTPRGGHSKPPAQPSDSQSPLERIISIIPTSIKLAIAALAGLLMAALAFVARYQRRLVSAERRAATDSLTGLPNRRHADEVVERLLAAARRNHRPLSVILFDLDHFKAINDRYGHGTGDDVLRATATATRGLLRGADHVARFGGEEFIVLLPETTAAAAEGVAEKLRVRLAEVEVPSLDGGSFTASFGVATYPDNGVGGQDLMRVVDEALYRAKEGGRNRVEGSAPPASPADDSAEAPALIGSGQRS